MQFKQFIKGTAIAAAIIVTAACSSTSSNPMVDIMDDAKDVESGFVVTGDVKVDTCGNDVAQFYGMTKKILDDYTEFTKSNTSYLDAVQLLADAKESATAAPLNEMHIAALNSLKKAPLWQDIEKADALSKKAEKISKSASALSGAFRGLDAATLKKIKSVKNMCAQAKLSSEFLAQLAIEGVAVKAGLK